MPLAARLNRFLPIYLLLTAFCACQWGDKAGELSERYLEGVGRIQDEEALVEYFDIQWTAVAWSVFAEELRPGETLTAPFSLTRIEELDRQARRRFFQRYGFSPPEKYFPPLLELPGGSLFEFGAAAGRADWLQRLREAGLVAVKDIPAHLNRWQEERAAEERFHSRITECAKRLDYSSYAATAVGLGELFAVLAKGPTNMRSLPHLRMLEPLLREGLVEARQIGAEVEWNLTETGRRTLSRIRCDAGLVQSQIDTIQKLDSDLEESFFSVSGPLIHGRYYGTGKILRRSWYPLDEEGHLGKGRNWIEVEMTAGVSYWRRPHFAGDTIPAVAEGPWVRIDPALRAGDVVGYREDPSYLDEPGISFWEKVPENGSDQGR